MSRINTVDDTEHHFLFSQVDNIKSGQKSSDMVHRFLLLLYFQAHKSLQFKNRKLWAKFVWIMQFPTLSFLVQFIQPSMQVCSKPLSLSSIIPGFKLCWTEYKITQTLCATGQSMCCTNLQSYRNHSLIMTGYSPQAFPHVSTGNSYW